MARLVGLYLLLGVLDKFLAPYTSLAAMPAVQPKALLSLSLLAEISIGTWLIYKPTRIPSLLGIGTLLVFISWSAIHINDQDCGCFANLGLHRHPLTAIITNTIALLLLIPAFKHPTSFRHAIAPTILSFIGASIILIQIRSPQQALIANFMQTHGKRSVLLKVSPGCEACELYTAKTLQRFSTNDIIAITFATDPASLTNYTQMFHIPIISLDLNQFSAFDSDFSVPKGYNVFNGKLQKLDLK